MSKGSPTASKGELQILQRRFVYPPIIFLFIEYAAFHYSNSSYSDRSILKALKEGRLTDGGADLIREFILEVSASQGLSTARENNCNTSDFMK